MHNRSVPTDSLLPHVVYQDIGRAIAFLTAAFGFVEQYRFGPPHAPEGAQLRSGDSFIMLTRARAGRATPQQASVYTQMISRFTDDVHRELARATAAGAKIIEPINLTTYGERQFVAQDPEGHRWLVAQHEKDVAPEDWGAVVPKQP